MQYKGCINWKTKGKCRKMKSCPYRHDDTIRKAYLTKKDLKLNKRKQEKEEDEKGKGSNGNGGSGVKESKEVAMKGIKKDKKS